jgi:cadmium resistance protein CadD (predicted permease)
MQCNIDAKGRVLRLITGSFCSVAAVVLIVLAFFVAMPYSPWVWVGLGVLMLAVGLFQIYEGWAGWCVVRAMGFRTKI